MADWMFQTQWSDGLSPFFLLLSSLFIQTMAFMRNNIGALLISFLLISLTGFAQTGFNTVTGFGSNPGLLNMYSYVPAGITGKAPLVIAMHGCGENAALFAQQTGWDKLADEHHFYVVYPEQNLVNNSSGCFNWFLPQDEARGSGEPLSILQMIQYMQAHYDIDSTKIFVTGLSAGGCMTTVMMACYPDVFNAGAEMAGVPYKAATNFLQADSILLGEIVHTPQTWGDLVRSANPTYQGHWPRLAVFQGTADAVCNQQNATEAMKQWTNVNGIGQTPAAVYNPFNGNSIVTQNLYDDTSGNPLVESFFITNMPHGIALDTGSCYQQCGTAGAFAWEVNLSSTFWAAYFFGITGADTFHIAGLTSVVSGQSNVTYTVTIVPGTTYNWTVPEGATITGGQGTNQITVTFGSHSGDVSVTGTNGNCQVPAGLYVTVTAATEVSALSESTADVNIFPNPNNGRFTVTSNRSAWQQLQVYDLLGHSILEGQMKGNTTFDATSLPDGVYLVKLFSADFSASRLLVITR